jgi:hypothetical protein
VPIAVGAAAVAAPATAAPFKNLRRPAENLRDFAILFASGFSGRLYGKIWDLGDLIASYAIHTNL